MRHAPRRAPPRLPRPARWPPALAYRASRVARSFNAVGTQSAVLAGFAMTSFAEIDLPHNAFYAQKACLHLFVTVSICANLMCTASTTFVSVWGSGKALRGKDGSMDKAVEGMHAERCDASPHGRSHLATWPPASRPPPVAHPRALSTRPAASAQGVHLHLLWRRPRLHAARPDGRLVDPHVLRRRRRRLAWHPLVHLHHHPTGAPSPALRPSSHHLDAAPPTRQAWRLHHKFKLGDTETVRFDDILQSRVVPRAMEAEDDEDHSEEQVLLPQKPSNGVRSPARGRGYEV